MTHFPKSFTRSEMWLLQTAIVMGYALNPVARYYNQDDFFLDSEIWECFEKDERITLTIEELKDLRTKPALITTIQYGRFDTVTRLTKLGWQKARELANRWMAETGIFFPSDYTGERFWLELDNA